MRSFAQSLKEVFFATDWRLPASSHEMTLHDAIRINAGCIRNDDRAAVSRSELRKVDVCRYRSESDLHDQWR